MIQQYNLNKIVCGCDEAGRGALAGPVVAGAVVLPNNFFLKDLNDSKNKSPTLREKMSLIIKKRSVVWGIGVVNNSEIDTLNILNASIKAMHLAIKSIMKKSNNIPGLLLIDGNRFQQYEGIEHQCIIKGDSKYSSIAASSILAKTYRDKLMVKLEKAHPHYNWGKNKGYPTKEHKTAISNFGITKYHRKSFKLLENQYALKL